MSTGKVGEDTELSSGAAVGSSDPMTNQEQLESFYDSEGFLMIDSFDLDEATPDNRGMSL